MNKHFHDSLYYLSRAAEHARLGVTDELEPIATRVRDVTGRTTEEEEEEAPASTTGRMAAHLETVRTEASALEHRAENRARDAVGSARETLSR